jgi:heme exporter protein D
VFEEVERLAGMKYGSYEWWAKGKTYISCQSRMSLWVAINMTFIGLHGNSAEARLKRKETIKDFPESTNGCRCSECRYFRIFCGGK